MNIVDKKEELIENEKQVEIAEMDDQELILAAAAIAGSISNKEWQE